MAINKVEYGGKTLIDLTNDSVTPETLAEGTIAHNASGEPIVGIVPRAEGVTSFDADDYFIKGEILTNIRDSIWTNSPDSWAGCDITPEQMADAIVDVYYDGWTYGQEDGYENGYENGYEDCKTDYGIKIIDLTDSTWEIPAGWEAQAGYGQFSVEGSITRTNTIPPYNSSTRDFTTLKIGYYYSSTAANKIAISETTGIGNFENLRITFTGGVDVKNPLLIDWLSTYGKLMSGGIMATYDSGYDEGFSDGYDEGFSDGYDEGCNDGIRYLAYEPDKVPLMIQGLNSKNNDDLYDLSIFTTSLCGVAYRWEYMMYWDVVTSSTTFTISAINDTNLNLKILVHVDCNYHTETDWDSDFDDFFVEIEPNGSNSASTTLGVGGSQHSWDFTIKGVEFSYA